ncbi:MAG: DUF72 domain-containing protein [Candidatus Aminicenantes bacterium]
MKYFIGIAGWSYKDWDGIVYPEKKPSGFHGLRYLSRFFNFIEINSTFYRPPVFKFAQSWVKRTEDRNSFLFAVKLHQNFTHDRGSFSSRQADEFKFGIDPLRASGRLGALLVQFPWSFRYSLPHWDHLAALFRLFPGYPLALEMRHSSWIQPEFFKWLKENNAAFCNIDQPVFRDSIGPRSEVTNDRFAYVRLHGRNTKNWFKKDAGRDQRYDYLYSEAELDEWKKRIQSAGEKAQKVFIVTNNHYQGQAVVNALQIKNKLTGESFDLPHRLLERFPVLQRVAEAKNRIQMDLFQKKNGE